MGRLLTLLDPVIRFALPPRCATCGVVVDGDDRLCVDCWSKIHFLSGKGCALCGIPMEQDGLTCGPCLASPPRHDGVRAVALYDDQTRDIALRLKYGRRIGLARLIATAMVRLVDDQDALLIPVPLHRWRIWSRGFNQSVLIARAVSRQTGNPLMIDILRRIKATPPLRGLGARDRAKAVRAAFAIAPEHKAALKDRQVILVDDVYTSGATANACAHMLKRAGAARVTILCWARVPLDRDGHY